MANSYITSTSRFKPYTFAEMLHPVQIYTEAYNEVEDELANLDVLAGDVAGKLNNPKDKELVDKALAFQTELNAAMNNLYTNGLNADTRKRLAGLKAKYTKELNPINEAYKAYQEDQKYLSRMALEHPEILIEGAGRSVSDYMNGNMPQMMSVNTDDLMTQAMTMAKTQAGRTYRQSGWTSTAGGKFLERVTEVGLNDVEFNNALFLIQNPNITAEDLNISEEEFTRIKNNASLIGASMEPILNSPDFVALSSENKQKALNAVFKGVRAGFQYDRKTDTQSDPMFAHNLRLQEEAAKAAAKRAAASKNIGSDLFLTPDATIQEHINKFLNTLGKDAGKLHKDYAQYFKNGKLISIEEATTEANRRASAGVGMLPHATQYGYSTPYGVHGTDSYLEDYNALRQAVVDLGLDPNNITNSDFVAALKGESIEGGDVRGRKRARITSDNAGFRHIQNNIELGLKNAKQIEKIIGLNESEQYNLGTYRTAPILYENLLDSDGTLNILGVNMDYATGQLSASLKTKKGYIEILIPEEATFEAFDSTDLMQYAQSITAVQQGVYPVYTRNEEGKLVLNYIPLENDYIPELKMSGSDYVDYAQQEMDLIFGDLFNVFKLEDIND